MRHRDVSKLAVAAPMWAFTQAASAQVPGRGAPARISGTVDALSGDMLRVGMADRGALTITLPPSVPVFAVIDRSLADIRPGEFVGSAAARGSDGRLHAHEVHIFPDSMRGTNAGHRLYDEPEQSMTNATVDGVAEVTDGRALHLRYPGGEQTIEVGKQARVWGLVQGDRALLVPGAWVTVRAAWGASDALTAVSIQAEKGGVRPLP